MLAIAAANEKSTLAQITPDASLGAEQLQLQGSVINGGARRGANLFHSFSEFNVGDGQWIDFANLVGVDRILTRLTEKIALRFWEHWDAFLQMSDAYLELDG
jgi:large exoprotein involved in heme utilization and adhesion